MRDASIVVANPGKPTIFTIGVPFSDGSLKDSCAECRIDGASVPVWQIVRSRWPSGHTRWLWVHVPVPQGESVLNIRPGPPAASGPAPTLGVGNNGWELEVGGNCLRIGQDGLFRYSTGSEAWECVEDISEFSPDFPPASIETTVTLVEPSPLAPLVRVRREAAGAWRTEHLIRVVPLGGELRVWRRLTLLATEKRLLRSMGLSLRHAGGGPWEFPGWAGGDPVAVDIPAHAVARVNGEPRKGFPPLFLRGSRGTVLLEKGWQRFPAGLEAREDAVRMRLYSSEGEGLMMWPGTSFRHCVRLTLGDPVAASPKEIQWRMDPAYFASTGVLGALEAVSEESWAALPAYEVGLATAFSSIRWTALDAAMGAPHGPAAPLEEEEKHAPEYFGLQHYGDWPLERGRYEGPDLHHRGYADNEYDIPFCFLQQFARTGEWPYYDISREGVAHMADVDIDLLKPGMLYHGYCMDCDDHDRHRPPPSVGDHSWTDSLWGHSFLSGDIWAGEAAEAIAGVLLGKFHEADRDTLLAEWSNCERAIGWPMIQMCATVEARGDRGELAICCRMAAFLCEAMRAPHRFIEENRTIHGKPFKWWRTGGVDGSKTLMLSVCMDGLKHYYALSGDPVAVQAITLIADFLVEVMWSTETGMFVYERNAYGDRVRRDPSVTLIAASGLAYLYEQTKNERYRQIARSAFLSSLWLLVLPTDTAAASHLPFDRIVSARELGIFTHWTNAMAHCMLRWEREREAALAVLVRPAPGQPLRFAGSPQALSASPVYRHRRGEPRFVEDGALYTTPRFNKDALLIEGGESYLEGEFSGPVANGQGAVEIEIVAQWHWPKDEGGVCQRGFLYLSDEGLNRSAVTFMSFYGNLHLRMHDATGRLIAALETPIQSWAKESTHRLGVRWDSREAVLLVDEVAVDRQTLPRPLGGAFRRIIVGWNPAHFGAEGTVRSVKLDCGM